MAMTLKEAIGVKNADVDVETGKTLTHSEIYGRAIELLGGLDVVAEFIPFEMEKLRKAYKTDKHFNNTPIKDWDFAAGFITNGSHCDSHWNGLWLLYRKHGINAASCADGVCILKEAARRLIERAEENKSKPLMLRLLDAGYPLSEMDHHESDLYVYITPLTRKIVEEWCRENHFDRTWHCPMFKDAITGKPMYDCVFQYIAEYARKEVKTDDK